MMKRIEWFGHRARDGRGRSQRSKATSRAVLLAGLSAFACSTESGSELDHAQKEGAATVAAPAVIAAKPAAKKESLSASAPDAARTADGRRRVWVMMRAHAPLASVSVKKPWKQRGADVHKSLRDTAQTSQSSLLGWLKQNKVEHQSFWAVNTIQVTADDATIQAIQKRSDVERVIDGFRANVPKPDPKATQARIQEIEWNIQQVRAPEAWADFGIRGEDVVVATIDTGAEYSHPALLNSYRGLDASGAIDHAYNWHDPSQVCGSPSLVPCDNAGHGTHTMGTIAGDDGVENQIGVAPGVKWITAKGCEDFSCSDSALLSSAQWMLAPTDLNGLNPDSSKRPHIVSNSWGGGGGNTWYQEMVQAWVAAGIFPVFSNGNSGSFCGSSGSPGDYPEAYAVGAYDASGLIADFSSRGESLLGGIKPNISAPGVSVRSAVPGGYDWYSGTSMAAPHVAGAVALLWSAAPALAGDIAGTRAILDETAIDHEDLSCGGTPENNNVWGEGSLDVYDALEAAPIGPSGTLVGSVTATGGAGIAGAEVAAVGPTTRRGASNAAGDYSLRLSVGSYDVTASAFGYYPASFTGIAIEQDTATVLPITLEAAPSHQLDGYVEDSDGAPIFGAEVTILGTPLPMVTTDDSGYFSFGEVPEGTYSVSTNAGGCYQTSVTEVTLSAALTVESSLPAVVDGFGYQCRPVASSALVGQEPLGLIGDDNVTSVALPFPFTFYGGSYNSVEVTTNGFVSFADYAAPYFTNEPIPSVYEPNNAVYGFWDDLYVDSPDQILTATYGSAPERVFVIEYRNVPFYSDYSQRANFSIALYENGDVVLSYGAAGTPTAAGSDATAGIENGDGTIGLQYSHRKAVLREGLSVLYEIPFAGFAAGTVTDEIDGTALAGAVVSAVGEDGSVRETTTNHEGAYRLQLTAGPYEVSAGMTNYESETADIVVLEDQTTSQDFALRSARVEVSPGVLQLLVPQGESRVRSLNLANTGSLNLDFEVREAGGARASGVMTTKRPRAAGKSDANAYTTKALAKAGVAGSGPSAVGDVLFSFNPGLSFAWGLGRGQGLWLGDINMLQNHEFTSDGNPTGLFHSAAGSYDWQADLAHDTTHGAMCHLGVGGDNGIHCWDETTGDEVGAITSGVWTTISQRGLAYKPQDDSFFVGGWNEGIIYNVQGLSGSSPGEVISSCVMTDWAISGLAYNESFDVLWVSTNSYEDYIYQINPYDCTVLSVLSPPQAGGYQGAGLDLDEVGDLWMVSQSPNMAHLVESGVPSFSDVPWLSVSPDAGTVGPGGSTDLDVTVDTAGLTPGLYLATLVVQSNAANRPRLHIPVSLVVSGYVKAVNAGGDAYVDTTGETWVKPQAHVAGSWGYMQKGKKITTRKAISGTDDPVLFQSQHEDPYAYRFDNVPNGIYEVNLHFAELENVGYGKRLFDVIIESSVVLPAHDIMYEVGGFAANSYQFFVPVTDGRMDVRLVSRTKKKPVINAVRVAHRPDR